MKTKKGCRILHLYKSVTPNALNAGMRELLTDFIVEEYVGGNHCMTISDFDKISTDISQYFKGERKVNIIFII